MPIINEQVVKNIAHNVRIEITDEEAKQYTDEINKVLEYAKKMNEINTDQVQPTTHGIILGNILRQDEPIQSLSQEEALKNAPEKQDGHFKVPSVME